jgi:hypothetical protein
MGQKCQVRHPLSPGRVVWLGNRAWPGQCPRCKARSGVISARRGGGKESRSRPERGQAAKRIGGLAAWFAGWGRACGRRFGHCAVPVVGPVLRFVRLCLCPRVSPFSPHFLLHIHFSCPHTMDTMARSPSPGCLSPHFAPVQAKNEEIRVGNSEEGRRFRKGKPENQETR